MIRFRRSKFFKYRSLPFALCFLVGLLMTVAGPAMGSPESRADKATPAPEPVETKGNGEVLLVSLDGTVNPGSADFFRYALERATAGSYEALVIQLDTPGGLVDSTRDIVQGFLNSTTPVVVYVAPQGARAGSAGVMITLAAHVAAMAPSTNIGAAHPVAGGGQEMDETMTAKITNDTAAWIEGIAEQRGRNKEWAVKAVRDSESITSTDALKTNVIDLIAENLDDLLAKIDGRKVTLAEGKVHTLATDGAKVVHLQPSFKHTVLMRLADPNIGYMLMIVGFLGIYTEFSHPGLIVPGVVGAICFLLFLMSTQVLPINLVGMLLIVVAMVLFFLETQTSTFGILTAGGALALLLGSLFLYDVPEKVVDSPDFSLSVSWALVIPVTAGFTLFVTAVMFLVVKVQRARPSTGHETLIGAIALAATAIDDRHGQVKYDGVRWTARSRTPIPADAKVRITASTGSTVTVEPAGDDEELTIA